MLRPALSRWRSRGSRHDTRHRSPFPLEPKVCAWVQARAPLNEADPGQPEESEQPEGNDPFARAPAACPPNSINALA